MASTGLGSFNPTSDPFAKRFQDLEDEREEFQEEENICVDSKNPFVENHLGRGKLVFKDHDIVLDNTGAEFKSSGLAFKINLEDFQFKKEIGRGQQGQIWHAFHLPTGTEMALKEIPLEMDQTQMKNVLIELEVLSKNRSPFIIDFFGAFYTKYCVYICMELMDLASLNNIRKNLTAYQGLDYKIPEEVLIIIIHSVVSGLKFLSKTLSIMHRDVKPSNIVMNSKGQVKLCDFGISGYLVKSGAKTYIGSMPYMAPERIMMNKSDRYTTKADLWSLGATLVEMIMARPLYAVSGFDSAFSHLMSIANDPVPKIPESAGSPELLSLINSFLSKNPQERPDFDTVLENPVIKRISDLGIDAMNAIMKNWIETSLPPETNVHN